MEQLDPKRIQEALRIANSPTGQQLIRHLQQNSSEDLKQAITYSANGDYTKAKQLVAQLAKSPELQTYMKQLGREQNG